MKQSIYIFILFIAISYLSIPLFALEPVVLTDSQEKYPLGLHLEILEDREGKLKIEDVAKPAFSGKFIKSDREVPNYGFTGNAYWVRFKLINKSSKDEWLLEAGYPLLDRIELFTPVTGLSRSVGQTYTVRKAGESFPFKQREIKHQNCVFYIHPPAGEGITYYIRFESMGSMQLPLIVYSSTAFAERDHEERILLGLYYGIIIALLLYNLFLFFSLRDKNYLYYVLYLANYALVQLSLNGIAFEYLWPEYPWWSNISMPFLISLLLIWLSRFASNILISRVYAPKIDKFFSSLFIFSVAGMLCSLFGNYYAACYISIGTTLVFIPVALVAGIISWRKGYRPARYFVMAWSAFLCGSFVYILRAFGLLPNNFITTYGIQIGSTLEVVLLSLALADRINTMRQEKEDAQTLAIENLHKADKLKDEFLANTSHELKTPLNGIIGITEALIEGSAGRITSDQSSRLTMILTSSKRLLNLVNDILDFSKLKHHDIVLNKKHVDMRQLTDLVMMLSKPMLGKKPVQLKNEISKDMPAVVGDENRLQQIMHNLISNAIKFTDSGTISVKAKTSGKNDEGKGNSDFLEITVSDTGTGIPEDKYETIFKSFEQADASISRLYGGAGLGLTISKKLIELHGGSIRVKSASGKGSDFIFTLPVSGDAIHDTRELSAGEIAITPAILQSEISPVETSAEREYAGNIVPNILAVDDDPINLQVIADQLSIHDYTVKQVSSGKDAIEAVKKDHYDLVLLDIMMPGMNGYDVCKKLRGEFSQNELPVIMLTAKDQVPDLIEGFDTGANDYLTKPISTGELLSRIKTHLEITSLYKKLKQSNENVENLMKEFSRLTSRIHNSLKNKLESIRNFMNHSISIHDDREKLGANLEKIAKLISHCSNESKNILFVITHRLCSFETFIKELELQAEMNLSWERINYSINKYNIPYDHILTPGIVQNLLDIYSELLNNIVKHSAASEINIEINYENEKISLTVKDNGIGFDYDREKKSNDTYGLNILEELSKDIDASLFIESKSGHGTTTNVTVNVPYEQ